MIATIDETVTTPISLEDDPAIGGASSAVWGAMMRIVLLSAEFDKEAEEPFQSQGSMTQSRNIRARCANTPLSTISDRYDVDVMLDCSDRSGDMFMQIAEAKSQARKYITYVSSITASYAVAASRAHARGDLTRPLPQLRWCERVLEAPFVGGWSEFGRRLPAVPRRVDPGMIYTLAVHTGKVIDDPAIGMDILLPPPADETRPTRFPRPGTVEWGQMNRRRAELIRKKLSGLLEGAERAEYEELQRQSLAAVDEIYPLEPPDEERERQIEAQLREIEASGG